MSSNEPYEQKATTSMTLFSVMTWNVENFFRPKPGAPAAEVDRFQRKLPVLSTLISIYDPDVVALQEVGGDEPLLALQEALEPTYPHRAVSGFADGRGIAVAFLSKHPIDFRKDIVDFPDGPALMIQEYNRQGEIEPATRMGRGALHIRVTKEQLSVDIITTHLKSKLLSFPKIGGGTSFVARDEHQRAQIGGLALLRRTAESVTLRHYINDLLKVENPTPVILLGDMNDVPEAQTSLIFNGPPGSEIGTRGFDTPDKGDAARLFNLSLAIEDEKKRYSRIYRGRGEMLDQIFASEGLLPLDATNKRRKPVVESHIDFQGRLPSITEDPNERDTELAPDHAPVTAKFDI